MTVRAALPIGAALLCACSFTAGLDGFVGAGAPDRDAASDDGPQVVDSGDAAAAPDAAFTEASTDADADADADAFDPDAPPTFLEAGTSFCDGATGAFFCEDFDRHDLGYTWSREGLWARIVGSGALSPPNHFVVDVPAAPGTGSFVSKITRAFSQPSSELTLSFAFDPEKVDAGSAFLLVAALEFPRASAKYSLRLVYLNGQLRLEESNLVPPPLNEDVYHPFFPVPQGKWSRLRLDVSLTGTSPSVEIRVDDASVAGKEPLSVPAGVDLAPTLVLGAVFGGQPHTGWVLRYDDVRLDAR